MAKRKTGQAPANPPAGTPDSSRELTWNEEQFIEAYIDNGGNATQAYRAGWPRASYETAKTEGNRLLTKPHIRPAVDARREEIRRAIGFEREKALRILIAIATTTPDQVQEALSSPSSKEAYTGLKDKKFAISAQKTPDGWFASAPNASERRAAINDLWEKLGLGKDSGSGNWFDGLEGLTELVRRVKGGGQ